MAIGSGSFAGSILLTVAIILGLIATIITYLNSRKLKKQVFEKPFIYFSIGIFLVTLSLIAVTFLQGVLGNTVELIHDISFIIGLGLMLLASIQITKFLTEVSSFEKNLPPKKVNKIKEEEEEEEDIKVK